MKNLVKKILSVTLAFVLAILGAFSYVPLHALHLYVDEVHADPLYSSSQVVKVTSVTIPNFYRLTVGGTSNISKITYKPDNATNDQKKIVAWYSEDPLIANVDSSGTITAYSVGETTIYATSIGGVDSNKCTITVSPKPVTKVSINKGSLTLSKGQSDVLTATVEPDEAFQAVIWESDTPSVATVDNDGKVTAVSSGKATITATTVGTDSSDNPKTAKCTVTVNDPSTPTVAVTSIKLDNTKYDMWKGESFTLKATIEPSNATNKNITWKSNNSNVSISGSGTSVTISGDKAGDSTITATTEDGGKTATCTVKSITMEMEKDDKTLDLKVDESDTFRVEFTPSYEVEKGDIKWESDNSDYVEVEKNSSLPTKGNITAKKAGKTVSVSATVTINGKKKSCSRNVKTLEKNSSSSSSSSSGSSTTSGTTGSAATASTPRDGAVNPTALANANSSKSIQSNSAAQKNGYGTVSAVTNALGNNQNRTKLLTSATETGALKMTVSSANPTAISGKLSSSVVDALGSILSAQEMFDVVTGNATASVTLILTALDSASVASDARSAVEGVKKANENLYYFGSDVVLTVNNTSVGVTQFGAPIAITYDIPTSIRGNSSYNIIRTHAATVGGPLSAVSLPDTDKVDSTVTISTDKMCVMAFAYTAGSAGGGTSSGGSSSGGSGSSGGSSSSGGSKSSASSEKSSSTAPGMSDLLDSINEGMANADIPALMGTIAIENMIIIIEGIIFLTSRRRKTALEFLEKKPKAPEQPKKVSPRAIIH